MPFNNVSELAAAYESGKWFETNYFKQNGAFVSSSNQWIDASVGYGSPVQNFYPSPELTPTANQLINYNNKAIYTGPLPAEGQKKYLISINARCGTAGASPAALILCDYLMHYSNIDLGTYRFVYFKNPVSLPRYIDGDGVMGFIVTSIKNSSVTASGDVQVLYTNSDGVSGRTTSFTLGPVSTTVPQGQIISTGRTGGTAGISGSPFFPLQAGDRGIRSIQGFYSGALGNLGWAVTLVLCKPLTQISTHNNIYISEKNLIAQGEFPVEILPGSFLGFLMNGITGTAQNISSTLRFVWE